MRQRVTAPRLNEFMKALGVEVSTPGQVFLVGGATAVLLGWRESTIDIDLKVVPDNDLILKSLPELKERLELNIELSFLPARQCRNKVIR